MSLPLAAIIGLPNSGKSTLFNKILERRTALTHPEAGTTRDRAYGRASWNGVDFYLVDTAGLINRPDSELEKNIQKQTRIAIEEADLIILLVDGKSEPSAQDLAVAQQLNRSKKPIVLGMNKIDSRSKAIEQRALTLRKLGLNEPILLSAANGSGVGDLLDAVTDKLKAFQTHEQEFQGLKIAFVGKPNVGKSSLINALLKENRLIVDSRAGTTRSTVEVPFTFQDRRYLLLDTAGIKRKWKQDVSDIEAAAAMQSIRTIPQVEVALFTLDASAEVTFQDQAVAQKVLDNDKPVVVVLNKTDLLSEKAKDELLDRLPDYFPQLWWAPAVFASAKTGLGLEQMLKLADEAHRKADVTIEAEDLDAFLDKILKEHMPGKMGDQRAPKIYNLKQIGTKPPTFKLTVNFPAAIANSWRKYFEKQLRLKFGFEGSPIVIRYFQRN
ncbi:MAG: ribosome biogenesis GTPase Der [Candidatus Saccharibacteria bacterium]